MRKAEICIKYGEQATTFDGLAKLFASNRTFEGYKNAAICAGLADVARVLAEWTRKKKKS